MQAEVGMIDLALPKASLHNITLTELARILNYVTSNMMYFVLCPECPPESVCMLFLTLTFVSLTETMT